MNDILPGEVETWQFLESEAHRIFQLYGFAEVRVPVVEKTELFCRSIGETTDIVEKEMYTFSDRSDNSLTLRPEGTAPVMRAFIEHKLHTLDPLSRLYYMGPMFRYERPQKGRYRQFHQIGVEAIGVDDPMMDAQILAMLDHYFEAVDIRNVELHINSLGCKQCRPRYRETLTGYLESRLRSLCADCQRRYLTNPLRVLDCKVPACQEATVDAPSVLDLLCDDCDTHFRQLQAHLHKLGIVFTINARMVRGLDYYTKTTFEMVTNQLGSQNAVAAGGRYDGLIQDLGGPALPGIGFAMGVERLVLMKGDQRIAPPRPQVFLAALGDAATDEAFALMTRLQRLGLRAEMAFAGKSLKAQMRRAGKLGARFVLILGDEELASGQAQLRDMDDGSQTPIALEGIGQALAARCLAGPATGSR
ncbi:histidine--tRNA ligase [Syntrophotalea acetylenica]|jgi:histidyl-tRNA synthetase|uniref:Histidine--tRNA ligase n=1 Tax=Syntrophotalea acetylenica TaxID=29542 RepID=A0A1L3GD55_SYNAC|nr:histidine--tRNA ligase [Syntrophotalea acetylenica]APG23837.1 histidine--tRNA ligase [Syntrophotalea acetylenica]APG44419.1 histidine--tRNA ligase [Syntrophotalea acetylenica]